MRVSCRPPDRGTPTLPDVRTVVMTSQEHADRVARNTLELNQARRQLAAVRAARARAEAASSRPFHYREHAEERLDELLADLEAALTTQPTPPTEATCTTA